MDVDTSRTAISTTAPSPLTPSTKKTFSLDLEGRVIGGRDKLMAAGACFYCQLVGHKDRDEGARASSGENKG
jgi:hypothetical protein